MSDSNVLASIDQSQLPATVLRPLAKPELLIALHAETVDFLQQVLVQGTDYGAIAGERAKAGLFKAGAEKVAIGFGLVPKYEIIEQEVDHDRETKFSMTKWETAKQRSTPNWDELQAAGLLRERRSKSGGTYWQRAITETGTAMGLYRYLVLCRLYTGDNREVGQGVGAASSLESKYIRAPRDSENTILKMAKKRAMVDAVLTAAGLSDRFTQDTEDVAANARARGDDHVEDHVMEAELVDPTPDESWRDWTDGQLRAALGIDTPENGKALKEALATRAKIAPRELYLKAYETGARDFAGLMAFVEKLPPPETNYRDVIKAWSITDQQWEEWKEAAKAKGVKASEALVAAYLAAGVRDLQDAYKHLAGDDAEPPAPVIPTYDPFAANTSAEQSRWWIAAAEAINGSNWDRVSTVAEQGLVHGQAAALGLGVLEVTLLRQTVAEAIGAPDPDRWGIWLIISQMIETWPKEDVANLAGITSSEKSPTPRRGGDNGGAS